MGPGTSSGPGTPIRPYPETVIPSIVRRINTFTIPGVGPIQYWVADTKQNGICTALRLANGEWDGLQNDGRVAGSMPGCRATRKQLSDGALILDGFDYEQTSVAGTNGKSWAIEYGAVTVPNAAEVRETINGVTAPIIDGQYFAIALQPARPGPGRHRPPRGPQRLRPTRRRGGQATARHNDDSVSRPAANAQARMVT